MKAWRGAASAALSALIVIAAPTMASAEEPVTFGSSPIVDTAGVLGGATDDVLAAIETLREESGRQLFVAYVDEFTDPSTAQEWSDRTAALNNFGDEDYLLAVAVDGRAYWLSASGTSGLDADDLRSLAINRVEAELSDGDWAGAAIVAAEGLHDTGGGGAILLWVIIILLLVAAGAVVFAVIRRRRKHSAVGGSAEELPSLTTQELKRRAASALVQTDDAVRTSSEELGFAIASYGEEATQDFRHALETSRTRLSEAFALKQRLDDAEPDTEEQQRAWHTEIIHLTDEANRMLDEQVEKFDELRALEQNAPQEIARLTDVAAATEARLPAAITLLGDLRSRYANSALAPVADNPEQASSRIAFARTALVEAREELESNDPGGAAIAIRGAEEGLDQAANLLSAIETLGSDMTAADAAIAEGLADVRSDIAAARAIPAKDDPEGALATVIDATETIVEDVASAVPSPDRNPIDLLHRLEQANTRIDAALHRVQQTREEARRRQAALQQSMLAARSEISTAEAFIDTRRGAIGAEARTRLAEAQRGMTEAERLAASDPTQALQQAQRASRLAAQAIQSAQSDVGRFSDTYREGGIFGGVPQSGSRGGDVVGAVLGGILINSMLGGGGGRRGRGASRIGRRGSGGIFGGRSGGIPGSFGGSRTRTRRGAGGRF